MRFDQLPTELLVMIARKSDIGTRGRVIKTNQRMFAIFCKFEHAVDRMEISTVRKDKKVHTTITLINNMFPTSVVKFGNEIPLGPNFPMVYQTDVLSFRDMDCGNYSMGNVFEICKDLKVVTKLEFNNCFFIFAGDFLHKTVEKYEVKMIEVSCPNVVNTNVQNLINEKFLLSFRGEFQFNVKEKTNVFKVETRVTGRMLFELRQTPRRRIILENIHCQFSPVYLVETIWRTLYHYCQYNKVDWNLGVIVLPQKEITDFHKLFHSTVVQPVAELNGICNYKSYYIEDVIPTVFAEYAIQYKESQIMFTVQYEMPMPASRKRLFQESA